MSNEKIGELNEHTLEVRYKPNPKILDSRGKWAEIFSTKLSLPEWTILENRFDVHDKQRKETVFVGFRNAGYVCIDSPTRNYFPDKAVKLFRLLLTLEGFDNPLWVERIGVRSKFITSHPKGFDDLKDRYATRYLVLTEKAKEAISAKLVDIGGPLNFADKFGNFNTSSGPMAKDQIKDFIPQRAEYPDTGLYYDIDYWQRPNKELNESEITRLIKSFAMEAWDRHERVRNLICGD